MYKWSGKHLLSFIKILRLVMWKTILYVTCITTIGDQDHRHKNSYFQWIQDAVAQNEMENGNRAHLQVEDFLSFSNKLRAIWRMNFWIENQILYICKFTKKAVKLYDSVLLARSFHVLIIPLHTEWMNEYC